MNDVPINWQFEPIEVWQFGKWTDEPIFNEKSLITQGLNIGSRHNEISSSQWFWNDENIAQNIEKRKIQLKK